MRHPVSTSTHAQRMHPSLRERLGLEPDESTERRVVEVANEALLHPLQSQVNQAFSLDGHEEVVGRSGACRSPSSFAKSCSGGGR